MYAHLFVTVRKPASICKRAWVEENGRWSMPRGNWRRGDRDGDGVPNRRDQAPNNPNRS